MFHVRYLHEEPLFRSRDLRIRGVGIRETMPPSFVSRPGTGDVLFMLFHSPVRIGLRPSAPLREGSAIVWTPHQGHHYGDAAVRWSHSWIHCDGGRVAASLRASRLVPDRPFVPRNPMRLERILFDIHEELAGSGPADARILGNLVENLLREAGRRGAASPRPIPPGLARAKDLLDAGYHRPLALSELAAEAGLSAPHFCTAFRRRFGMPPIEYLLRLRMRAAATLVRGTALPLGEIGRAVGCPDPYHFSKLFKKHVGVPASRFRG